MCGLLLDGWRFKTTPTSNGGMISGNNIHDISFKAFTLTKTTFHKFCPLTFDTVSVTFHKCRLNIARIANATQVTLWLSVTLNVMTRVSQLVRISHLCHKVTKSQDGFQCFAFLLAMSFLLILLINCQKGHMCLRQLCSALTKLKSKDDLLLLTMLLWA